MQKIFLLLLVAISFVACKKTTTTLPKSSTYSPQAALVTATQIQFAGYTWNVKDFGTSTAGPGPNRWNKNNVWVDANGYLHLKISKNASNKWECAEISSVATFGNGTFQWQIDGNLPSLNKNVVLGLFNYSGIDGFDEMDIEFAKWGVATNPILNYSIYPAVGSTGFFHTTFPFTMVNGTASTHRFIRSTNSVVFQSMFGYYNNTTNLFATSTCTSPTNSISNVAMPIFLNLWLFQGNAPSDKKNVEIIIRNFTYTP
jgi:hypothetical protein